MHNESRTVVAIVAASLAATALANGIRPPRSSFAVNVTCTRGKVTTKVPNARVEGLEAGKRSGALRVATAGKPPDLVALHAIRHLRFDRPRKVDARGFARAELRRWGSDAKERSGVQVRTAAGPVRLVSFGTKTAVELMTCDEIDVERWPDSSAPAASVEAH